MLTANDLVFATYNGKIDNQVWNMFQAYQVVEVSQTPTSDNWPAFIQKLMEESFSSVFTSFKVSLSTTFSLVGIKAYSMLDAALFGEYIDPTPTVGTGATTGLGPNVAYGAKAASKLRGVRPGFKRFPGVIEGAVGAGGAVGSTDLALFQAWLDDFSADQAVLIVAQFAVTLRPIIVKRIKETDAEGNITYRLPQTLEEAVYYKADPYAAQTFITTQNSRKYGRGI